MKREIVVVGFPKCGTSALIRSFQKDPDVECLLSSQGRIELTWPEIRSIPVPAGNGGFVAHKFSSYIFNQKAIEYFASERTDSVLVVCIRDPRKSIISWHRMHQSIARKGNLQNHFAYLQRDFYSNCSIEEYYERYGRNWLKYDDFFSALLSKVAEDRVIVTSQEQLSRGVARVEAAIKAIAAGEAVVELPDEETASLHRSYADSSEVVLAPSIEEELEGVYRNLMDLVAASGVHKLL